MAQARLALQVYTTGTVSGNAGSAVIAGVGTSWITVDSSGNAANAVQGGDHFVTATGSIPIKSVDSALQITLEAPLAATINAGSSYRIIKYVPNQTGPVLASLLAVQAQGSDTAPDTSRTIDSGASRVKLRIAANGDAQIAVGPTGTADAALATAIDITQAGAVGFSQGISSFGGYAVAGFHNRIRNGNFAINQRAVSGTVTLSAGQYGHDGVKGGASGATYTFGSVNGVDTVLTISAGSVLLPIEGALIDTTAFVFSHSGTATARIYQGSSTTTAFAAATLASGGLKATGLATGTTTYVEVSTGSLSLAQFEPGSIATPFERRPTGSEYNMCLRYYFSYTAPQNNTEFYFTIAAGFNLLGLRFHFPVAMRAAPTVIFSNNLVNGTYASGNPFVASASTSVVMLRGDCTSNAGLVALVSLTASAEI